MKRAAFLTALVGLSWWAFSSAGISSNLPRDPQKVRGAALGLFASDPDYDYGLLVNELHRRGPTDVMVVVQWSQPDVWSAEVNTQGRRTASPQTVARTIGQLRQAGMRVTLMPIVRLDERTATQWRGNMSPEPERWFASYRQALMSLAHMAQREGVQRLMVGSELGSMHQYDARWKALIEDVRGVYDGRLGYSANWDDFRSVGFWGQLDDIGVTGYFPLGDAPGEAWRLALSRLEAFGARQGKPLLLTEVGYPSHRLAATAPWDQTADRRPDPELQARLIGAFCDAATEHGGVDGYFFWNWFGLGGPRVVEFSPRGKPAAAQMERCWSQRG